MKAGRLIKTTDFITRIETWANIKNGNLLSMIRCLWTSSQAGLVTLPKYRNGLLNQMPDVSAHEAVLLMLRISFVESADEHKLLAHGSDHRN